MLPPREAIPALAETVSLLPVLLLVVAACMFVIAASLRNGRDEDRQRLLSAGLACWIFYTLLHLVGAVIR